MKDQTNPDWLQFHSDSLGTAILVYENEKREVRAEYLENVTHLQCVEAAQSTVAFKWVPLEVASYSELIVTQCLNLECFERCGKPGCMCIQSICQRPGSAWGMPAMSLNTGGASGSPAKQIDYVGS